MIPINIATGVVPSEADIRQSELFSSWLGRFDEAWRVVSVDVHMALAWRDAVRMACITARVIDPDGMERQSLVFLRGMTVDILPILVDPSGRKYVVFVEQPRVPVGQMVVSTPAGMVDEGDVVLTALQELDEEVGGAIPWGRPEWLNDSVVGPSTSLLVSPGSTDEEVFFCTTVASVTAEQIEALHGHIAGDAAEHERTRIVIVPLDEARAFLSRSQRVDMKTVLALLLLCHVDGMEF